MIILAEASKTLAKLGLFILTKNVFVCKNGPVYECEITRVSLRDKKEKSYFKLLQNLQKFGEYNIKWERTLKVVWAEFSTLS
jgi:hypothetical protein